MPTTVPSHPAAVLPLKLRWPHRFDGVALVVGATSPDIGYAASGLAFVPTSHAWHSLLWFNLPMTLLVAWLLRQAAPSMVAHLPRLGPLAVHDYGVLATVRHPLPVTVISALLGALSHMLWDSVTHPFIVFVHPFLGGSTYLPALRDTAIGGLPWWQMIHLVSEAIGATVAIATIVHIGRRRLLVEWHGTATLPAPRHAVFWSTATVAATALLALALVLPNNLHGLNVLLIRLAGVVALALLVACATVARIEAPLRRRP